jgi:hypothetical protein
MSAQYLPTRIFADYDLFWLLNQSERRALDARSDFDAVSRLVKLEYARFEQERIEDLKETMERYIEEAIDAQSKVCQSVRPVEGLLADLFLIISDGDKLGIVSQGALSDSGPAKTRMSQCVAMRLYCHPKRPPNTTGDSIQ